MTMHRPLFLSKFNPCPSRVDPIEKSLAEELDEQSMADLYDHMNKCQRCKRYHTYMEAVDQGFREHSLSADESVPNITKELPLPLQEEMVEAMKRNLSKWLLELGRGIRFRKGRVLSSFLDFRDTYPLNSVYSSIINIAKSFKDFRCITCDDSSLINHTSSLITSIETSSDIRKQIIIDLLKACLLFNRYNLLTYFYKDQLYATTGDYQGAIKIVNDALSCNPSPSFDACLTNTLGRHTFCSGDIKKSIVLYKSAMVKTNLPSPVFYLNCGYSYLSISHLDKAASYFNKALYISDNWPSCSNRNIFNRFCSYFLKTAYINFNNRISSNENLRNLFLGCGCNYDN